mgnify:CR=1 FL=1
MNFFSEWRRFRELNLSEASFVEEFLNNNPLVEESFENCDLETAKNLFSFISTIDIELLIAACKNVEGIASNDVVQFSSLKSALFDVPAILDASGNSLSYVELGSKLNDAVKEGALLKYGENHGKLAIECGFARKTKKGSKNSIELTKLGEASTYFSDKEVFKVFKIMILRNKLIQKIVYNALKGKCSYVDYVSFLSEKTIIRRRSNVKMLVEMIFDDTKYKDCFGNIRW